MCASERSLLVPTASARFQGSGALGEDVGRLKYVSGAREEALRRLGIETVEDLLTHIPRRYLDFTHALSIEQAPLGEVCTVVAQVDRVALKHPRPRLTVVEIMLVDDTGVLRLSFFKQPWMAKQFAQGDRLAVQGKVEFSYGFKQMASPHVERLDDAAQGGGIIPVHAATEGLSAAWMRRIVSGALETVGSFADALPARLRARRGLMSASRALRAIHFPQTMTERDQARRRLAYEELLYLQMALRLRNDVNLLDVPPVEHATGSHVDAYTAALPFTLSDEQRDAVNDIVRDMTDASRVMNRLLLGDVGTGKTVVAGFGLAVAADSGTQACVMAPTSVLAQQYAVSLGPLLNQAGISWALLTGATPPAERADITARLRAGTLTVLFGTHAVLSDDVVFRALTFVVIDEQHRFGVNQRNALRTKGTGADLLVMTATPIPRTLALSVYGDLDTSIIRHRPVAGAGVSTSLVASSNRDLAYDAIRRALAEGRQAYVICPLVDASDSADELDDVAGDTEDDGQPTRSLHNVRDEVGHLSTVFPEATVASLHGRMPAHEKEATIDAFRAGTIDILVSTTVVEVGVDVPNATVMLIEDGERFGLATLHQLRGRVGRGAHAGTCLVMAPTPPKGKRSVSSERLQALEHTEDGFALAELDLRLRHEGEILGLRQHGGVTLRFVDLDDDVDDIEAAHEDALELLRYASSLQSVATMPMRHRIIDRYGDVFKEVSGG